MKIKIYQIDADKDDNNVMFLSHDRIERYQGFNEIDSKIYNMVYEKNLECSNLEDVYMKFNVEHPQDYKGRSLSVSDVVEICESEKVEPGFYFCDSIGFKEVEFDSDLCEVTYIPEEQSKISVLYIQTGKYPEILEIENTLEAKQELVGGDIEMFCPYDDECAIIVNDNGKIFGLPLNRAVYFEPDKKDKIMDIMAGDFFVCSAPYDSSEFESLTPEMTEKYMNMFKYPERFLRWGRDIVVQPYEPEKKTLDEMMKNAKQSANNSREDNNRETEPREDYEK